MQAFVLCLLASFGTLTACYRPETLTGRSDLAADSAADAGPEVVAAAADS